MEKIVKIFLTLLILAGIFFVYKYPAIISQISGMLYLSPGNVAGISTSKAEEITNQLRSDLNEQLALVKKQAFNMSIADILQFSNRTQKVVDDFKSMQNYLKDQARYLKISSKSAEKKYNKSE